MERCRSFDVQSQNISSSIRFLLRLDQVDNHVHVNGKHVPMLCALEAGHGLGKPGVLTILAYWLGQHKVTVTKDYGAPEQHESGP